MAVWRRLLGFGVRNSSAATVSNGIQSPIPLSYNVESAASVTIDTALQLSSVWACVRLLTESIGSLPIKFYRLEDGVRYPYNDHPLSLLLSNKPNRRQNRIEFMNTMIMQRVLLGNAYALINRNSQGQIISLQPMMAEQMEVILDDDGSVIYQYQDGADVKVYGADKIWHLRGIGNGVIGLSPLDFMRNSVGIAQAAENTVSKIYRNGAKPSGLLMIDKILTDAQRTAIKANFASLEEGTEDRLFVLEAGMQYQQVSMSPQDIELLSTRRYQIEDIARYFGVPSVLINDTQATTAWGSGIEQIVQGFYKLGLRPYLESIEASIVQSLLPIEERQTVDVELDFSALLMPNESDRVKMYKEAITGGIYAPNEARKREGMIPIAGGDDIFMQQQMTPIAKLGADLGQKSAEYPQNNANQPNFTVNMPPITFPDSVKMNIPAPIVHVETRQPVVNVAAPAVNFDAKMETPIVNIAPPVVNVAAPVVNMSPDITLKMPKRKTTTNVKYDSNERIASTTQIEEDA